MCVTVNHQAHLSAFGVCLGWCLQAGVGILAQFLLHASSRSCAAGPVRCPQRWRWNRIDFKSHGTDAFTSSSEQPSREHKQNEGNKRVGGLSWGCREPPGNDTLSPHLHLASFHIPSYQWKGEGGKGFTDTIPGLPLAGFFCWNNYLPGTIFPPSTGWM